MSDFAYRVGLANASFDLLGAWVFDVHPGKSKLVDLSRRMSKTATLDGNVYLSDFGYSDGDRTLFLLLPEVTEATENALINIIKGFADVTVSMKDGCFSGKMKRVFRKSAGLQVDIELKALISG